MQNEMIRVCASRVPLKVLAWELERASGVKIQYDPSLAKQLISADIQNAPFEEGVKILFRHFNQLAVYSPEVKSYSKSGGISEIRLLPAGSGSPTKNQLSSVAFPPVSPPDAGKAAPSVPGLSSALLSGVLRKDPQAIEDFYRLPSQGSKEIKRMAALLIHSDNPELMEHAALALARTESKEAATELVGALRNLRDGSLRSALTQTISEIRGDSVVPYLENFLLSSGEDPEFRLQAGMALANMETKGALVSLINSLSKIQEPALRNRLTTRIAQFRASTLEPVIRDLLNNGQSPVVKKALEASLKEMGFKPSTEQPPQEKMRSKVAGE